MPESPELAFLFALSPAEAPKNLLTQTMGAQNKSNLSCRYYGSQSWRKRSSPVIEADPKQTVSKGAHCHSPLTYIISFCSKYKKIK